MKKLFITILLLYGFQAVAQVKIGDNPNTINANSLLELEATNKGLLYPRVALTATSNAAPLNAHVQGMTVYNTATTGDVTPGLYANDGSKWIVLGLGTATSSTVTVECNGFTGNYNAGASARTFVVTYTNNSFSTASVTPVVGDLVLNTASGLTVASVSPNTATTINSGATRVVTYTLGGSLSATPGTVITGTFTKFGLSCSKTVATNVAPVANAGNAQTINIYTTTSVSLSGSATDSDGTIASYAWTKTGGTGSATPVITSPSSATTTVTGINTIGTYIFTLTATDNNAATATSTVTITANIPSAIVGGPGGTTLSFMEHNLGADYSADANTPAQALNGNYYQWGRSAVAATAATSSGAIAGWNTTVAASNSWNSGTEAAPVKTANDPCPAGYRIPTAAELGALLNVNGNTYSHVGTFSNSPTNFNAGLRITYAGSPRLYFPAAGNRSSTNGTLTTRGSYANYYNSNFSNNSLWFNGSPSGVGVSGVAQTTGCSIKCIKI